MYPSASEKNVPIQKKMLHTLERMHTQSLQSCPTVWDSMDDSPPGSPVNVIFLVRMLEWFAMPSCMGSSQPKDQSCVSCFTGGFFTHRATWEAPYAEELVQKQSKLKSKTLSLKSRGKGKKIRVSFTFILKRLNVLFTLILTFS